MTAQVARVILREASRESTSHFCSDGSPHSRGCAASWQAPCMQPRSLLVALLTFRSHSSTAQVARTALKKAQLEEHEERLKRAVERSQAPAFKRQGKPVMKRSRLAHKAAALRSSDNQAADHEIIEYLQRVDLL